MVLQQIHNSLFKTIDEENIEILVRDFYVKVLQDSSLAPFFIEKLGSDFQGQEWEEHLILLINFWKGVALGYEEYTSSPLLPHFDIQGINIKAFENWLELFHATVDSIYTPSTGKYFKEKSTDIAENFIRRLQLKK